MMQLLPIMNKLYVFHVAVRKNRDISLLHSNSHIRDTTLHYVVWGVVGGGGGFGGVLKVGTENDTCTHENHIGRKDALIDSTQSPRIP